MEQPNHKEKTVLLQEKLIQYLTGTFSPKWLTLCFYAAVRDASVSLWLCYTDCENDLLPMPDAETNDCFCEYNEDCPVRRSEAEQRLAALVSALHGAYRAQGKNWRVMLCSVTPNGTVQFEFEYADVSVCQAVVNAAVRRQGAQEPVQPPEPLPDTEMIRMKQTALEQYLISIMPVPWKKICLFADFRGGRLLTQFAVLEAESDTVCWQDSFQRIYANAGYYVPGRTELNNKVNQLAASLFFFYGEAMGREKVWRSMFLTITPDGSSHTEFVWAPFSEEDDYFGMKRAASEFFFGGA